MSTKGLSRGNAKVGDVRLRERIRQTVLRESVTRGCDEFLRSRGMWTGGESMREVIQASVAEGMERKRRRDAGEVDDEGLVERIAVELEGSWGQGVIY